MYTFSCDSFLKNKNTTFEGKIKDRKPEQFSKRPL